MPTPDTSPANVARVLTKTLPRIHCYRSNFVGTSATCSACTFEQEVLALIDALNRLDTAGDWGDCLKCSEQLNREDDPQATGYCPRCRGEHPVPETTR